MGRQRLTQGHTASKQQGKDWRPRSLNAIVCANHCPHHLFSGLPGQAHRTCACLCLWACAGQELPSDGHCVTPTSHAGGRAGVGGLVVQRQIPTHRIIPGRLILGVWWQPHQGLSLSPTVEKASDASLPQPQIP